MSLNPPDGFNVGDRVVLMKSFLLLGLFRGDYGTVCYDPMGTLGAVFDHDLSVCAIQADNQSILNFCEPVRVSTNTEDM